MKNAKLLVNLDWLSFSFVATDRQNFENNNIVLNDVPGYRVEKCSGTNVFQTRYLIYDSKGLKVLTWLADAKSNIINSALCLIEFSNHTLYTGEWQKLFDLLPKFHSGYVHRLSRVDICGDFQSFLNEDNQYSDAGLLADMFNCNAYYVQGKRSGACFFEYNKIGGRIERVIKQFSWGSKSSQFKWKLYNKTKEITEESFKYYIAHCWHAVGFDLSKNTWRLECSIVNAGALKINDVSGKNLLDISNLSNSNDLLRLFNALVSNKFVVRLNECEKNSSRNKIVNLFNFQTFDCDFVKIPPTNDFSTDEAKSFIRKTLKSIENSRIRFIPHVTDDLYNIVFKIVNELSLNEWFFNEFGLSIDTYYFAVMQSTYGIKFLQDKNLISTEHERDLNKQLKLF